MSDNETLKSTVVPDSCLAEAIKSDQDKNAPAIDIENLVASVENQNAPMQDIECNISHRTEDEIVKLPAKEINAEEVQTASEIVKESAVQKAENNTSSEIQQNESSNIPKIERQIAIGAGDTCFVVRQNENVEKSEEKNATDSISVENDKLLMENDKNVTDNELTISKLKEKFQKMCQERDSYQKKLENTEKKLNELQILHDGMIKGEGNEAMLRRMVDDLQSKLKQTSLQLNDRNRTVSNQEKQISALNNQVASMKEVESLTKNLLQIRTMEVKHLQTEVDDMEVRINEERERYNTMINKMDAAVKLNADLKKEYETQLCLFRDLRGKYEEKVTLLSEEKRALEANAQSVTK